MVELTPELVQALGTTGIGGKIVYDMLGPSAQVLGQRLAQAGENAVNNIGRLVLTTHAKLGDRVDEPGAIPTRSLVKALDEAAMSDDEIVAEYLGGVLASGRREDGTDDRGVYWTGMIGRLSVDQLRLHYALYDGLRLSADLDRSVNLLMDTSRKALKSYVDYGSLLTTCGWLTGASFQMVDGRPAVDVADFQQAIDRFSEAFSALHSEDLVDDIYGYGGEEALKAHVPFEATRGAGLVWIPSVAGIRLYLWGHGHGDANVKTFLDEDLKIPVVGKMPSGLRSSSTQAVTQRHKAEAEREASDDDTD